MRKLDNQVLDSYNRMLDQQEEPAASTATGAKQSIFSPSRSKQPHTPLKTGAHKTPSKLELENQK